MGVQAYRKVVQCSTWLLQPALAMFWVALMSLNTNSVERETAASRLCLFSYKVGDRSTKAEAASDRFALFLRAALG